MITKQCTLLFQDPLNRTTAPPIIEKAKKQNKQQPPSTADLNKQVVSSLKISVNSFFKLWICQALKLKKFWVEISLDCSIGWKHCACGILWSPAFPIGKAMEGGHSEELDTGGGVGSVEQNIYRGESQWTLSLWYVMVICLTHGNGVVGRGGCEGLQDLLFRVFRIHELAHRSLWYKMSGLFWQFRGVVEVAITKRCKTKDQKTMNNTCTTTQLS